MFFLWAWMFRYMLGDPSGSYFIQCFAAHPAAVHTAHVSCEVTEQPRGNRSSRPGARALPPIPGRSSQPGVWACLQAPLLASLGFVVWEVWLVWLRFLCPLLPRLVRAPSAPGRQGRLHLLLVFLSWCALGNSLRPLTFFVCACFLGRKSLSEVNILCEMRNNHENCWALVFNFSSWRLCRI